MIFHTGGTTLTTGHVPDRDVHVAVRDLRLRHGRHARRGDPRPAPGGAEGDPRLDHRRVRHRRHLPLRAACSRSRTSATRSRAPSGRRTSSTRTSANAFSTVFLLVVAAAIFVCCLAIQTSTIRLVLRHGPRRRAARLVEAAQPGASQAPHPDRLLHRDRRPRVHPDAPVRGRRDHRDRGDRDDLPVATSSGTSRSCAPGCAAGRRRRRRSRSAAGGSRSTCSALAWGGGMLSTSPGRGRRRTRRRSKTDLLLNFHWSWLNDRPVFVDRR